MRSAENKQVTVGEDAELRADTLSLDNAVIGGGLVLQQVGRRRLVIHELSAGRARLVGSFGDAAKALAALDELEGF